MDRQSDLLHELRDTWAIVERSALARTLETEMSGGGGAGLRPVHVAVLRSLGHQGATMSEVARQLGITRQSVAQTVTELVDHGIIEMIPDPKDGRAKILRYTAKGKDCHEAALRAGDELEAAFAERVGETRARQLFVELAELRDVARRYCTGG